MTALSKSTTVVAVLAALFIIIISCSSFGFFFADASVMGIDLGIESIKIAAPKNNNMDIILNEQSHRKSWNAVGFRSDERYFADEAKNLAARFPDNMFLGVNRLVGVNINNTKIHQDWYRNTLNYKANIEEFAGYTDEENDNKTANERGYAGVSGTLQLRTGTNPNITYSAESLTAMLFTYIKTTVEKDSRLKVTDAVITVPAYFDRRQRQATIDAAELAGIRTISLMHPTSAAALQYGMNRRGFGNETVSILVLDVGSAHTDAGVYTFTPPAAPAKGKKSKVRNAEALGTITTRAIVSTKDVGGRIFDSCLAKYIEDKFVAANPKTNKRILAGETVKERKSIVSLMRAANKAKEILSANRAAPIIVEGINPDRDFPITITREEFHETCAPLFNSIPLIVKTALARSGLSMEELTAFEMFGAGTRIPKIVEDLTSMRTDGKPVDRTLNTDEAAALGAGFYAGALAGRFRIKSFGVSETVAAVSQLPDSTVEQNFTFSLTPKPDADTSKPTVYRTLYHADSKHGARKSITVQRDNDFGIYVYHSYLSKNEPEKINHDTTRTIERFVNVTGVEKALDSVYYYFAPEPVKEIKGESADENDNNEEKKSTTEEGEQQQQPNVKYVAGRPLRHNNNSHQIKVEFRLSESGLLEVDGAELRATYIQNVSKKIRVNLTAEEVEEAKEKARNRVVEQEKLRLAKKAEEEAARKANESAAPEESEGEENKEGEEKKQEEEQQQQEGSEEGNAAENNATDSEDENNTTLKKKKPAVKKEENATAILERKLKIALNAVRTYRVETKYVEEARRKTVPLTIQQNFFPPTPHLPNDKTLAKRILRTLDEVDRIKRETAAAKNDLEGYIVWAKNEGILDNKELRDLKLLDDPEVEKKIVDALNAAAEWLEEDGYGDDVPKQAFDDKLKELHVITGEVIDKFQELTQPKKKKSSSKKSSNKKSDKKSSTDDQEEGANDDENDDEAENNNNSNSTSSEDNNNNNDENKKEDEEDKQQQEGSGSDDTESKSKSNEKEAEEESD